MSKLEKVVIWAGIGIAILQATAAIAAGWNQLHPKPVQ